MIFRSILSGTLALLMLSGAGAHARSGLEMANASFGLPGVFGSSTRAPQQGTVQLAQVGDPRVTALEEQLRKLNGTIEELNFQILQMQEQIRKMQEDNEFRFQELEKKSDASGGSNRTVAQAPAQNSPGLSGGASSTGPGATTQRGNSVQDIIAEDGAGNGNATTGAPPRTFGTITVDKNGNVIESGGSQLPPATSAPATTQPSSPASGNTQVAALPATNSADELYRNSYQFVLSGDYATAEQGFRDHIARFPNDQKTADARFWLGEAQLGQKKYRDAAETFLTANKAYPKSKKAPEMLLKLGVSLAGLKQRDVACATFAEVNKRYPDISAALKERVNQERSQAKC